MTLAVLIQPHARILAGKAPKVQRACFQLRTLHQRIAWDQRVSLSHMIWTKLKPRLGTELFPVTIYGQKELAPCIQHNGSVGTSAASLRTEPKQAWAKHVSR